MTCTDEIYFDKVADHSAGSRYSEYRSPQAPGYYIYAWDASASCHDGKWIIKKETNHTRYCTTFLGSAPTINKAINITKCIIKDEQENTMTCQTTGNYQVMEKDVNDIPSIFYGTYSNYTYEDAKEALKQVAAFNPDKKFVLTKLVAKTEPVEQVRVVEV